MSRRILVAGAALVLLVAAGGIAAVLIGRADPASIRGTVTNVSPVGAQGVILVEERPQDQAGSNKAMHNGQLVAVWFTGPVLTSYPVQATASVIVVP